MVEKIVDWFALPVLSTVQVVVDIFIFTACDANTCTIIKLQGLWNVRKQLSKRECNTCVAASFAPYGWVSVLKGHFSRHKLSCKPLVCLLPV